MYMPATQQQWTLDEVERLIDERPGLTPRYELVDGALLVTPAPTGRHQRIILELAFRLGPYITRYRLGEVRLGPAAVRLGADARFEPDLFVIPAIDGRMPRANDPVTRVSLVVEVLSPGSVRHDRFTKRRAIQRYNVRDYWVVDGDAEAFEIWHPDDDRAVLIDDRLTWQPEGAPATFELDVRDFFAAVADEVEEGEGSAASSAIP